MPRGEPTPPCANKSAGLPYCSEVNLISLGNFQAWRVNDDIRVIVVSLCDTRRGVTLDDCKVVERMTTSDNWHQGCLIVREYPRDMNLYFFRLTMAPMEPSTLKYFEMRTKLRHT